MIVKTLPCKHLNHVRIATSAYSVLAVTSATLSIIRTQQIVHSGPVIIHAVIGQGISSDGDQGSQVGEARPQSIKFCHVRAMELPVHVSNEHGDFVSMNLVRAAQKRSRGLCELQILRSPTCGPKGVVSLQMLPLGTTHARPHRIGT